MVINTAGINGTNSVSTWFPIFRGEMKLTIKNGANAYFSAADSFLGDKLRSYQHAMTFYLWVDDDSNPYSSTEGDVILTGKWFNQALVYKFDKRPNTNKTMFRVLIVFIQSFAVQICIDE